MERGQCPQRHQEEMHITMLTKITIVRNIIDLKDHNRHPVQDREKESTTSLINAAASIVLNVIDMVIVNIDHRLLQNKTENDPNERNSIKSIFEKIHSERVIGVVNSFLRMPSFRYLVFLSMLP